MTVRRILNGLQTVFTEKDLIFCVGDLICQELSVKDDKLNIFHCLNPAVDYLSFCLGLALSSDIKIYVLCEDKHLLSTMDVVLQAAASKRTNYYIIALKTKEYCKEIKQPTLFDSVRSFKGVLFNMGVLVHDYSMYFKDKTSYKKLRPLVKSSMGPLVSLVSVENSRTYGVDTVDLDVLLETNIYKISKFIRSNMERESE